MAKYPLEPLVEMRATEVEEATLALAAATRAREASAARLAEAEASAERFLADTDAVVQREAIALASGVLRAGDLAQGEAFKVGATLEHRKHRDAIDAAAAALARSTKAEDEARAHLAERKASAEAVARHRAGFEANARRVQAAKDEEAADEVSRARRPGGTR